LRFIEEKIKKFPNDKILIYFTLYQNLRFLVIVIPYAVMAFAANAWVK
jgi:hypothetical protein